MGECYFGQQFYFLQGYAKYTFENLCIENPKIKLNDRTYKYFFIAENYDKILDERQQAFLKLVMSNESSDSFGKKISKLVEDAKHNAQWRKQFMELDREFARKFREGLSQGLSEGAINKAIEDAVLTVRKYNASPEEAAKDMGAPLDKVLEALEKAK